MKPPTEAISIARAKAGDDLSESDFVRVPHSEWMALNALAEAQAEELVKLRVLVSELQDKLRVNSGNSSVPPSQNRPGAKPKARKKKKGGRKRGAQKGHKGHHRELLPADEVDNIVHCELLMCAICGGPIIKDDRKPVRQQQFDIPEVKPVSTEFQRESGVCELCSKRQLAPLAEGSPNGILGPRALAMVATLAGAYRLSKRLIRDLLADAFNLPVSLGTVSNADARVTPTLLEPHNEALTHIRNAPVVHADETGHRNQGQRAWVWLATTSQVTAFLVRGHRSKASAVELLGQGFFGVLISDRYCAYLWVETLRRQLCWAHLDRDFERIRQRDGPCAEIGRQLKAWTRCVFAQWHRFLNGELSREQLQEVMKPIKQNLEGWLEDGRERGGEKTAGTCGAILELRVALWTYLDIEGVVPTNNAAEQRIRHYVVWRKCSYGSQSQRGDVFLERILTVVGSLRLQNRNILDFVTASIRAFFGKGATPSLLPAPSN